MAGNTALMNIRKETECGTLISQREALKCCAIGTTKSIATSKVCSWTSTVFSQSAAVRPPPRAPPTPGGTPPPPGRGDGRAASPRARGNGASPPPPGGGGMLAAPSPPAPSMGAATAPPAPPPPPLETSVRTDVCVIGAGYAGLSTALALAERGVQTIVL